MRPHSRQCENGSGGHVQWRSMDPQTRTTKMTRCRDCDGEISRRAERCPRCGAPGPRLSFGAYLLVVCLVAGVIALLAAVIAL